jgi:hypothetical protein
MNMNAENTQGMVSVKYTGDLDWLCRALSTDETRFFMNGFLAEKEGDITRLAATDGKRMHIMETRQYGDIPAGIWLPLFGKGGKRERGKHPVILKAIDGIFPDWRRVVPDSRRVIRLFTAAVPETRDGPDMLYSLYRGGIRINPEYLKPLSGLPGEWEVCADPRTYGRGAALFKLRSTLLEAGEKREAVIMPMRKTEPVHALLLEKYGAAMLDSIEAGYDDPAELYEAVLKADEEERDCPARTDRITRLINGILALAGEKTEPEDRREEAEPEGERGEAEEETRGEARAEEAEGTEPEDRREAEEKAEPEEAEAGEEPEEEAETSLDADYPAYLAAAVAAALEEAA